MKNQINKEFSIHLIKVNKMSFKSKSGKQALTTRQSQEEKKFKKPLNQQDTNNQGSQKDLSDLKNTQLSDTANQTHNSEKANSDSITNPSWDMFQIIQVLGEGAYGKVYKVKCLKS